MADCTFGGGGHSVQLLEAHNNLRVLGCDLDNDMVEQCHENHYPLVKKKRLSIVHSNYVHLNSINVGKAFGLKSATKPKYDILLMDLGFSSYQVDGERGFSYLEDDQELDMRYDTANPDQSTALDILNSSSEYELIQIL